MVGEFLVAPLADTKVTHRIVVDSIVTDGSTNSAHVADKVEVGDALEVEGVPDGAAILGAGQHPAPHTVEFLALPTNRPAQLLLFTLGAGGLQHLLVRADKELQLVPLETLVRVTQAHAVELFLGDVLAVAVVVVKVVQRVDAQQALRWVVGTEEI